MKTMKTRLLALILLATGSVWADWVKVGSADGGTFYFDSASIVTEAGLIKVWSLTDNEQRNKFGAFSERGRYAYDCKRERFQVLSASMHSKSMARGEILISEQYAAEDWSDIPPNTPAQMIMKKVCIK